MRPSSHADLRSLAGLALLAAAPALAQEHTVPDEAASLRFLLEEQGWVYISDWDGLSMFLHADIERRARLFQSDLLELVMLEVPRDLDAKRIALIANRRAARLSVRGYERWHHSMSRWEIDCGRSLISIASHADFTKDNESLSEASFDRQWVDLRQQHPRTPMRRVFAHICEDDGRSRR